MIAMIYYDCYDLYLMFYQCFPYVRYVLWFVLLVTHNYLYLAFPLGSIS